jgi:hypothetical protein
MAKTNSRGNGAAPSLLVVIGAVALLLAIIGGLYYWNFGPKPIQAPPPTPEKLRLAKIFKESNGDYSRVSEDDKLWFHQYSGGREAMAWDYLKKSQGR